MKKRLQEKKKQASGLLNEDSSVTPASHLADGLLVEEGEAGLAHDFKAVLAQPQTSAVEENNRKSRTSVGDNFSLASSQTEKTNRQPHQA
ncbi:hypothetical protein [Deinococcus wulumuqiensis]|uniref:hypothetical protein n=1 Tax=Deinococcus wulumuqiensis TaxID=980427 RepID=UPI00178C6333|nr:hypothetical protein [Deinococcus wulumuqiensis]